MLIRFKGDRIKSLILLMSMTLLFSMFSSNMVSAQESDGEENQLTSEELEQIITTLTAIEEIPDELLASGDSQAINQYFNDKGITSHIFNPEMGEKAPLIMQPYGWWGCSLSIAELLVMNAIPIAKITKIKKYIKDLGGAVESAKLLVGATSAKEKAAILSALVAELTGFTNVKNACNL